MRTLLICALLSSCWLTAVADPIFEYFGADNNEAEFTLPLQLKFVQTVAPTKISVDPQVRSQLRFMLGLMRSREKTAAALYPKWSYTVTEIKKGDKPGTWNVKYMLKAKGLFATGTKNFTFTLPTNPKTLFAESQGKCMTGEEAEESNFWYHWEPLLAGCPLKEGENYYNVTAELTPKANTEQTYPEYSRLVDANKTIKMTMFFGLEHYDSADWNPADGGEDWGIKGYNLQREFLKSLGFSERLWSASEIAAIYTAKDNRIPYITEMELAGPVAKLRIRLILADSGFAHNSRAFHAFLKESLAKESVIVYDGHSGIGKNLDIPAIERLRGVKMPMSQNYQILFLGSCVPYAYYPEIFFSKKRTTTDPNGTKNLDIFTYGKEAIFGNKEDQVLTRALVRFSKDGARVSYQTMIRTTHNFYFAVNGDEDNPTQ